MNITSFLTLIAAFTIVLSFSLSSCTFSMKAPDHHKEKLKTNLVQQDYQEEQLLGKLLLENFVKEYGIYRDNKPTTDYIVLAGQNLSVQFGRSELSFKFGILNSNEVNAYSLPNGYIFLTRGLLKNIKSESELASVLGHEIAHINQKHIFNSVKKKREVGLAETLSSILSLGKASMSAALNQAVSESVQLLTKNGMNPEHEFEADEYGVNFAAQAGYRASDYVELLKRLQSIQSGTNLSMTHPPFEKRIERINLWINDGSINNQLRWDEMALKKRFGEIKI